MCEFFVFLAIAAFMIWMVVGGDEPDATEEGYYAGLSGKPYRNPYGTAIHHACYDRGYKDGVLDYKDLLAKGLVHSQAQAIVSNERPYSKKWMFLAVGFVVLMVVLLFLQCAGKI